MISILIGLAQESFNVCFQARERRVDVLPHSDGVDDVVGVNEDAAESYDRLVTCPRLLVYLFRDPSHTLVCARLKCLATTSAASKTWMQSQPLRTTNSISSASMSRSIALAESSRMSNASPGSCRSLRNHGAD